ncbi:MAG: TonB-dependent receptor [bacterium]|nr:TonB-dependent receptor [bacterium]
MLLGTLAGRPRGGYWKAWIVASAVLIALTSTTSANDGLAENPTRAFTIATQDLDSALKQYADQSSLQVFYPSELVEGLESVGVEGRLTAEQAMAELLTSTGLEYRFNGRDTIVVGDYAADEADTDEAEAQAEQETAANEAEAPAEAAADEQQDDEADAGEQEQAFADAITVTGSNIPRIQQETALPLSRIEAEDVLLREPATTTELFEYIPQASGLENQEGSTGPNDARGDAASVNLRGLGSGSTLVLLNGRRLPPHPISSGAVPRLTVNVNSIPARALERVEVLRDGASAIYGTDAAAGVINAIVKSRTTKRYEATARYGGTDDGPLTEGSLSFSAGFQPNQGQTSVFVYADGLDRDGLRGGDKDFASETDLRERAGSTSTRWDNRSVNTPNGRFRTGTANPDGSFTSGKAPGAPDDDFYIDNSGVLTFGGLPRSLRFNYAPPRFLIPDTERYNLYTKFDHQARSNVTVFGDLSYYRADSLTASAPVAISGSSNHDIFVPSQNFYNPFGDQGLDVLIRNYRPVELGDRLADVETTSYRLLLGTNGYFGGKWTWEAGLVYGEAETVDTASNMLSESRLRAQLALDTPDAWNVFGRNPENVLNQVRINPRREGNTTLGLIDGKVTGILAELPAGPMYLAGGVELRSEDFTDRRDALSNGDDVIAQSQTSNTDGDRDVASIFAELSIPIVADKPGFHALELTLAGRYEDYSDFGDTAKPKLGVSWYPAKWLLARASFTEGFKAPNLAQLFTGQIPRRTEGVQDPYRADVTGTPADLGDVSREIIRGGNVNLQPEESETQTFGLVFQPPGANSFYLSVDYWDIEQTDRIDVFGHVDQLDLDFLLRSTGQGFNGDVVRADPTAADLAAFGAYNAANPNDQRTPAGEILFVRDTFFNLSGRNVAGWDVGLSFTSERTSAGRFKLESELTWYDKFEERKDADTPAEDQLEVNGNPEFRGNASVTWSKDRVGAGLFANYTSEFTDTTAPAADGGIFIVEDWMVFNANVHYTFRSGLNLRFSVNNLADEAPPLADEIRGFFNNYHSARGRTAFLTARMSF